MLQVYFLNVLLAGADGDLNLISRAIRPRLRRSDLAFLEQMPVVNLTESDVVDKVSKGVGVLQDAFRAGLSESSEAPSRSPIRR